MHPLPVDHAVLQEPLGAMAWATQVSIPLPLSHTPRAFFFMYLRPGLFLVTAHSAEADVVTWTAWLHYRKEKQFISCCSVTKGKTASDIALFPFPEGEAFVSYWQWGTDTKSPCCHWRAWPGCTAWISIMWMLHWTLRPSFPLSLSPTKS